MIPSHYLDHDGTETRVALRSRLLSLPFSGFARVIAVLLEKMGYSDVSFTSRKDFRGRNGKDGSAGGYDLTAVLPSSGVSRRVIVQTKQFNADQRIFQRNVDELRGACLRTGAAEGILLTTGPVSSRLPRYLLVSAPFAPIRLVDSEELLDLLFAHRVGIWREERESNNQRFGIDEEFFASLLRKSRGNGPEDCVQPATPSVRVTISVESLKRKAGRSRTSPLPKQSHQTVLL